MPNLLFEIGTEELPPKVINDLSLQIKNNIINGLIENNIQVNVEEIKTFYTPRRICVYIQNLLEIQETKIIEIKGPEKEKAYDLNNIPTKALLGFAKKHNIHLNEVFTKPINNTEYIFAKVTVGGKRTTELLREILPSSIKQTTGDKFMSWGMTNEKFSRPIRWIVSIFGKDVVVFSFAQICSDKYTYGHRFFGNKKIQLNNPDEYLRILKNNFVIADPNERKTLLIKILNEECKKNNANLSKDHLSLVEEVNNITEFPSVILCGFDKEFLSIPSKIVETVLEKHQKYFPLYKNNNQNLLPNFLVITNGIDKITEKIKEEVQKGNEKVVKARLNDAKFFLEEDFKTPFTYEARINKLSKITFQKGLGSMHEKVERIIKLSKYIYEILALSQDKINFYTKSDVIEVAKLCKLDLTTQIVFELPELQGKIGTIFAKKSGYSDMLASAIEEHYTNTTKNNTAAQIVGIADKLDNIISLFSINKIPTGSADPFALRGQTQWLFNVIDTIQELYSVIFKLSGVLNYYKDEVTTNELKEKVQDKTISKVREFLIERLKLKFQTSYSGFYDLVESTFSVGDPLNNLILTKNNLRVISDFLSNPKEEDKAFFFAARRITRIVEPLLNGSIDANILKSEEEKKLLELFKEIEANKINFNDKYEDRLKYYNALKGLTNPINHFFDKVLVNDPDPTIRQNRHALLKKGKDLFEGICDFNKIKERN